ncbi:MAG: 4Fe-4S binding protein [Termitinemataceae bacterium]|nr:MAG: 4Fe-4S binding protein [Termitinemataceae bacterium]
MKRKIIKIDLEKCDGCGLCAEACHEGAIEILNGKAHLIKDDYCDGLGNCLPVCPASAISFEEREAAPYKESEPYRWPIQIKLVSPNASFFNCADLLVAADCTAYADPHFHTAYMRDKTTIIGCPKLDNEDYSVKLGAVIAENEIKSVTVTRMEVPCCGGMEAAVKTAIKNSGKNLRLKVVTISINGKVLKEEEL